MVITSKFRRNCWLYALLPGLALVLPMAVFGQQSDETGPSQSDEREEEREEDREDNRTPIDKMVVTANRRESLAQRTAVSITAVSAENLRENNVYDISRISQLVPGMTFGQSGSDARPAIRGARTENVSNLQDPAVAFYVNGIYRSRTSQALAAFTDVERVEVLRGPQGTLWGRNAFGGAINIIAKRPDMFNFDFATSTTVGNFSRTRNDGYLNVPLQGLGDEAGFRLSWAIDNHDGKFRNLGDGADIRDKDETFLRGQFGFSAGQLTGLLRASYWEDDGNGNADFGHHLAGIPIDPETGEQSSQGVVLPLNQRTGSGNFGVTGDPFTLNGNGPFGQDLEQTTVDLELEYDLGIAVLKSITAYADFERDMFGDSDFSPLPGLGAGELDEAKTFTQEFTLSSATSGPLEWTVGAFYLDDDTRGTFTFDRFFNIDENNIPILSEPTPGPQDFTSDNQVDTESIAFYGQASYTFAEKLRLTGGIRYTEDEKDFAGCNNFNVCDVEGTLQNPVLIGNPAPFEDSDTFEEVTWLVDASYFVNRDVMVYAQAKTGFQSGGFNSAPDPVSGSFSFDEQTVDAYEVGIKSSWLNGRVVANVVGFYNDFDDLLAQNFVELGGSVSAVNSNAGKAEATGVEFDITTRLTPQLDVGVRGSYTDSEYKDFIVGGRFPDTLDPELGVRIVDLDGEQIQLTPEFTFAFDASYAFDLGRYGTLRPFASYDWKDDHSTNDRGRPFDIQGAEAVVDFRLNWASQDRTWSAQAFVENATNQRILNRTVIFGGGHVTQNFSDPRTWGIRLGYQFR